jgi:hypothetical protein
MGGLMPRHCARGDDEEADMATIPETTDTPTTEAPERTVEAMLADWNLCNATLADLFDDSEADCPVDDHGFILF